MELSCLALICIFCIILCTLMPNILQSLIIMHQPTVTCQIFSKHKYVRGWSLYTVQNQALCKNYLGLTFQKCSRQIFFISMPIEDNEKNSWHCILQGLGPNLPGEYSPFIKSDRLASIQLAETFVIVNAKLNPSPAHPIRWCLSSPYRWYLVEQH